MDLYAAARDYLLRSTDDPSWIAGAEEADLKFLVALHYPTGWDGFVEDYIQSTKVS